MMTDSFGALSLGNRQKRFAATAQLRRIAVSLGALVLFASGGAHAAPPLTVNAADNIYGAGQKAAPGGGKVPKAIVKLSGNPACLFVDSVTGSLKCTSPLGCITTTGGADKTDPDGKYSEHLSWSTASAGSISGIAAPHAAWLVGLFSYTGPPTGAAPPALAFTKQTRHFREFSPLINQTFLVGDGRIGDGRGPLQQFNVPAGARRLYFGISDSCTFGTAPGCYQDNSGTFTVTYHVKKSACPHSAAE